MNASTIDSLKDAPFRFCFTLDTEPDNLWEYRPVNGFESFAHLPEFNKRLIDAGARPTYLTTSEVVESDLGRSALEECLGQGRCEIGAHFHTWTRRWPFRVPDLGNPPVMAMAHRLGERIERDMLAYTCDAIAEKMGIEPRSYRGGRWSFGPSTPKVLAECGIHVDSTMIPGLTLEDDSHSLTSGPDFRNAPMYPHHVYGNDPEYHDPILELPVGSAHFPGFSKALADARPIQRIMSGIGKRMGIRFGFRWLRPTETSLEDMRCVMQSLKNRGCAVWVFMIHSSEIIPCRPLPTQQDVKGLVDRCLGGIRAAIDLGAKPATLLEAAQWVRKNSLVK